MELLPLLGFFALGSVLASFAGVLAERVHTGESWARDRSSCNSCNEPLQARDLVPVLSWASALGRARCCGAQVPWVYAASELSLGSLFALAYLKLGLSLALLLFLLALCTLAFVVLYDLRHTVVPIAASNTLLVVSLAFAYVTARSMSELGLALLIAGATGLFFFALHFFSRGRAMGLGDTPVALSLSLLAGPYAAIPGLLFSFWIGAVIGIGILVSRPKGHRMGIEVPFVPFLVAGYLLAYFTQWNPLVLPLP